MLSGSLLPAFHTRSACLPSVRPSVRQVRVKVARRTNGIPGVPGRPEPRMEGLPYLEADSTTIKEVRVRVRVSMTRWGFRVQGVYGCACPCMAACQARNALCTVCCLLLWMLTRPQSSTCAS